MSDPLAELNRLQERDLELDAIREDQSRIPDELVAARVHFKKLEAQLSDLQDQMRDVRVTYRKADLDRADLVSKRDKSKASGLNATTPKEVNQYNEQVRQISGLIEEADADILPLMEQTEKLEGLVAGVQAKVDEAKPNLDSLEAADKARVDQLEESYQTKRFERDSIAEEIPLNIVKEYESIRRARKGTGLAKLGKAGAGYKCTACNVQVPLHVAQQVHTGAKVVRCPSCGRILWKGE